MQPCSDLLPLLLQGWDAAAGWHAWLLLGGVNYRLEVSLNGQALAVEQVLLLPSSHCCAACMSVLHVPHTGQMVCYSLYRYPSCDGHC